MSDVDTYKGTCFCGAVQFTVRNEPVAMGYCHCADCRLWSAGPVNAFCLWSPQSVQVTKGNEHIGVYNKTPTNFRHWCTNCGGHLFSKLAAWDLVDVFAGTIPDFPFKPAVHVHYRETVLPMKDGLPKLKDLPKEMGGSGEALPE